MKKHFLFLILTFTFCKISPAQILCIYCYDQNDSISDNVNNLLLNGGFENGTCPPYPPVVSFCPNSTQYGCNLTNWTCTGGGVNTYACIAGSTSIFTTLVEGTNAAYFGNSHCRACSPFAGDTTCIIDSGCTVTGIPIGYPVNGANYGGSTGVSLEQTVNGLLPGSAYILEFWAGGEGTITSFTKNGLFAVDIGFGITFLRNKPTPDIGGIGTRYLIEFIAASSSHTIKFTNWGHICTDCTELVIDDVRLYTLAELSASVPPCNTGVNIPNFQNLEYLIYPNPVTNELNVKTNSKEFSEIILYDIASRKLLQQTFINSASINTEQLSKGIYLYEIRNKEGVIKQGKVVKK